MNGVVTADAIASRRSPVAHSRGISGAGVRVDSFEPPRISWRPICLSHAVGAVCSVWRWRADSASAGGRSAIVSKSRNQVTMWDDARETLDAIDQFGREEPSK